MLLRKMSTILRNCNDTSGVKELKARGFKDNVLNALKLALYDGNVDLACTYYHYDEWCHQYYVFSSCKHSNNCKGNHRYRLTDLIKNKKFCKGKLLCEYLLYFYTNYCSKQNKNKKRAWIAQLHWKCAQMYAKDKYAKFNEYTLAQLHYQQALKVCLLYLFYFCLFFFCVHCNFSTTTITTITTKEPLA